MALIMPVAYQSDEMGRGQGPRELKSFSDLEPAEAAGEVFIIWRGIVVNMPILVWPGRSP